MLCMSPDKASKQSTIRNPQAAQEIYNLLLYISVVVQQALFFLLQVTGQRYLLYMYVCR